MASQSNISPFYPRLNLFKITPNYPLPSCLPPSYLQLGQELVEQVMPEPFATEALYAPESLEVGSFFYRLSQALPIIKVHPLSPQDLALPITFVLPAEYTHGAGRYITDILAQWIIPGKTLGIISQISFSFRFCAYPSLPLFITQNIVHGNNRADLDTIQRNLPPLLEEMKVNIMAAYHARYITSLRSSPLQYKNMVIEENLSSLLNQKGDTDLNLYQHTQSFLSRSKAEYKLDEIKKNLSYLLTARPKAFHLDVFYDITYQAALFRSSFSSLRKSRHLSRVVAYHYLFKKILLDRIANAPDERHFSLKILRTTLTNGQSIVALLFGLNFVKETERFDVKNLKEAIHSSIPQATLIPDSLIADRRYDKIRFFYAELEMSSLSSLEMKQLKSKLPQEILRRIETVVHPVFMPRNDEELIRNLIVLNNQIKYKRDLPQVSIHYDLQSAAELTFTVILVRLLLQTSLPLSQLIQTAQTSVKFSIDDIRVAGYLKNKYPKESATLRVSLEKNLFFRSDYSVDLLRARQKIAAEVKMLIGEFRDFNGGIILKQDEALMQLRQMIKPLIGDRELLLENYFYSIRPGIMQTVYEPAALKTHFELLLQALNFPLGTAPYKIFSSQDEKYFFCMIKSIAPSVKEAVIDAISPLEIPSYDLATSFLSFEQSALMGMILRINDAENATEFGNTIADALTTWGEGIS